MREKPQIILHEQISDIIDTFNPAIRDHDGRTFAIEIANCQRDSDYVWHKDRIALIREEIEKVENKWLNQDIVTEGEYAVLCYNREKGFEECRQKILALLK